MLDSYCFCFVFVPATFIGIDVAFTSPWRPHTDGPSSFSISLHCDHFLFCAPPSLIFLEIVCFIIILLILPFLLWSSFPCIRNDRPCHCLWPSRAPTLALRILEYHRIANLIPGMVFSPKTDSLIKILFYCLVCNQGGKTCRSVPALIQTSFWLNKYLLQFSVVTIVMCQYKFDNNIHQQLLDPSAKWTREVVSSNRY